MTFVEIARVLFANEKITNLNKEAAVVQDYIKGIDPSHRTEDEINITSYNDIRNEVTKIQKQIISILSTSTYGKNIFFGIKLFF